MIIPDIKMISFDLFGVIFTEGHLISNVLMPLLSSNYNKDRVKSLYNDYNLGKINETEFWHHVGLIEYKQLRKNFLNSFQLDPEFELVIDELKPHYRFSILSNLPPDWAAELSEKFKFQQQFKPCLFSGYTSCKKPQPEIYKLLIAQSKLPPQQIAFIDDRLENLQTAHELGMTTIYYQREIESHAYQADFKIKKLSDLLPIFVN